MLASGITPSTVMNAAVETADRGLTRSITEAGKAPDAESEAGFGAIGKGHIAKE